MDSLRERIPQGMNPGKVTGAFPTIVRAWGPGTFTWVAPVSRRYRIVGWGPGGGYASDPAGNGGGGGGAMGRRDINIEAGQSLTVVVGAKAGSGNDTTVTLPDGAVCRSGGGIASGFSNAGGVATGWDLNLAGGAGPGTGGGLAGEGTGAGAGGVGVGAVAGGGGAGGDGYLRGGDGANSTTLAGHPGGGGVGGTGAADPYFNGADGLVLIFSMG